MGRKRCVNQPVIHPWENMEFSPNKKAMPIIISNSAKVTTMVSSYFRAQGTVLGADENNNCINSHNDIIIIEFL